MTPISVAACEYFPLPLDGRIYDNGHRITLLAPLRYVDAEKGEDITVPAGFDCDFNSIPRIVWWYMAKWEYPEAGIVHDWLYRNPGGRSRGRCDDLWRRILHLKGLRKSKRLLVWSALRTGSWVAWRRYRAADAAD